MRAKVRVAVTLAVIVVGTAMLVRADSDESTLKASLGQQLYEDCGLSKLDDQEQSHLIGLISGSGMPSYLEESATRLMEKDGWEPVTVLGLVRKGESDRDYHVLARHHGVLYTLRPSIIPHLPDPGVYWADFVGSHWEILYPDGSDGSFSATALK